MNDVNKLEMEFLASIVSVILSIIYFILSGKVFFPGDCRSYIL